MHYLIVMSLGFVQELVSISTSYASYILEKYLNRYPSGPEVRMVRAARLANFRITRAPWMSSEHSMIKSV